MFLLGILRDYYILMHCFYFHIQIRSVTMITHRLSVSFVQSIFCYYEIYMYKLQIQNEHICH